MNTQSLEEYFTEQTHTSFDSATGPLWRATYFTSDQSEMEKNIMFTFHHGITDGFSSCTICGSFIQVLNDVIGGKVQKVYNFGNLNDGHETEELTQKRMEFLKKNPEYFNEIKTFHTKFNSQKLKLSKFLPAPKDAEKRTKYIHGEIDKETTNKLLKTFKSKGISFHAGFCSVFNWVIMELLTDNGLPEEEIDLPSEHIINLRRYWKESSTVQLGTHVAVLKLLSKTNKNIGANFWEYAREFNRDLKAAIENMQGIDAYIQLLTSNYGGREVDFSELIENAPPPYSYYVATNMGDVSSIIQTKGDHVRIKWFTRAAADHCMNKIMLPYFQTFESRLIYCVAYSTHLLRDEFAHLFVEKIINKLKIISSLH